MNNICKPYIAGFTEFTGPLCLAILIAEVFGFLQEEQAAVKAEVSFLNDLAS